VYRYLAVVMDSTAAGSWAGASDRKDVRLTLGALNGAVRSRRPGAALVFHSDRGLEYGATAFRERLAGLGFRQSMNRPGKMTDNAFIESFFHSMKTEIYHGVRFTTDEQLRVALQRYVSFCNEQRLHSSLHYVPPATFERQARAAGCQ
jgi:putative transposase